MAELVPINSYHDFCDSYVMEQYKGSTRLRALIDAFLEQCDDLEQAWFEILAALNITEAVGPALDYIGALVGVQRVPGQTDDAYRVHILQGNYSEGLPTMEALRTILLLASGAPSVGIFPDWPAGQYVVFTGPVTIDVTAVFDSLTSGVMMARGTFLCGEPGDGIGYIVCDDNGMPFVIDWWPLYSGYILEDEQGLALLTEDDQPLLAERGIYDE